MLASFTHDDSDNESPYGHEPVVEDLVQWTMAVALNVISGAGFNLKMAWPVRSVAATPTTIQSEPEAAGGKSILSSMNGISFQQSVNLVANSAQFLILFPPWLLRKSSFRWMRDLQQSSENFVAFMRDMISNNQTTKGSTANEERETIQPATGDLLGSIVKAGTANKSMALNEEETIGNIFIFIMAGHETTASTLQTGLILLAANPQYQQVVQEEIDSIWAIKKSGEDISYEDYDKMRAIIALMVNSSPSLLLVRSTLTSPSARNSPSLPSSGGTSQNH
jgi:hypothetical protein